MKLYKKINKNSTVRDSLLGTREFEDIGFAEPPILENNIKKGLKFQERLFS